MSAGAGCRSAAGEFLTTLKEVADRGRLMPGAEREARDIFISGLDAAIILNSLNVSSSLDPQVEEFVGHALRLLYDGDLIK